MHRHLVGQKTCSTVSTGKKYGGDVLLVQERNSVVTLTLNRPKERNALNYELLQKLHTELYDIGNAGKNVRAVVINSSGPMFCSGHDLKEIESSDVEDSRKIFELCSEVMKMLSRIPQPTISAVNGMATAAGCQLVASSDIAIGSESSVFMTPGVNIGLFCSTPSVSLLETIPKKIALDMLLTGRMLNAEEANRYGLLSRIVPDEALQEEAQNVAAIIASKSFQVIKSGKEIICKQESLRSLDEKYDVATDAMIQGLSSEDSSIGIEAFLRKKEPKWKHQD